jgi:hypothetical protein
VAALPVLPIVLLVRGMASFAVGHDASEQRFARKVIVSASSR